MMSLDKKNLGRICISGYFDPLHVGHLEYIERSKKLGDYLVVIVNNDHQAQLKKGRAFMPAVERVEIIRALKWVDEVVLSVDDDRTVCKTLRTLNPLPNAFCNGGDQTNQAIPEKPICDELGIMLVDGLGDKIQSSSWLTGLSAKKS
jgi:cytidyltransferase-like protein